MQEMRKKTISFIAVILALLTLLPPQTVNAAVSTSAGVKDSGVYWSSTLPTDGDRSYKSDSKWYRLVLEYGGYSSNSVDSSGYYADTSPSTYSSWPSEIWNDYYDLLDTISSMRSGWIGSKKTELVLNGSLQRDTDANLYRSNEYTQDGMYSLYIKYAGKSHSGEDCWYISPCDSNGDREKKLWALDCCLDICKDDIGFNLLAYTRYGLSKAQKSNTIKPISDGITPRFSLLTPGFEEFESSDNFRYAGMTLPDYKGNQGSMLADYHDNHKWILTQNEDGSWALKSAGYISWNWTDPNGAFVKMFDDPAKSLANGLAHYARITAFQQYDSEQFFSGGGIINSMAGFYVTLSFFDKPWSFDEMDEFEDLPDDGGVSGKNAMNATPYVLMLFLTNYAENVYITGGYAHYGTELIGKTKDQGKNVFSTASIGMDLPSGMYYASYGMRLNNSLTEADLKKLFQDYGSGNKAKAYYPADSMGISVRNTASDGGTAEKTYTYLSDEEIRKTLPFSFESCWKPTAGQGAFSALYVGATLETEVYCAGNTKASVSAGSTVQLGALDKNGDGVCDGMAHIGTLLSYGIYRGSNTAFGPSIVIEKGAVLQIDGPTFAALGTSLTVKGSLVINSGASLSPENLNRAVLGGVSCRGISLNIDGGSVYISRSAMLDIGFADMTIQNGGSLINNGVFVQDTEDNQLTSYINMKGGTVENSRSSVFISGAEIFDGKRHTFLRYASTAPFMQIVGMLRNVDDFVFGQYLRLPYESNKDESTVNWRMYDSEKPNLLRNAGQMIVIGAVKGITNQGKTAGTIMNSGTISRAKDLYSLGLNNSALSWSFTCHEGQIQYSRMGVEDDFWISKYNSYTGITYSESGVNTDETGVTVAEKQNLFALAVGTGAQGTEKIANFTVNYVDKTGIERSEYISPADLAATYEFVSGWKNCGTGENEPGSSRLKADPETRSPLSGKSFSETLEPVSNKVFLFQTLYPLDYVTSLSFTGSGSGSWTCTELNVYRVSYLYPLEEYGWRSEDWYVPFTGSLIAETALKSNADGTKALTFNWDSETVEIGKGLYQLNVYGAPEDVKSRYDTSGFSYYNVSYEKKPYSTADEDYTIAVSLADADGAGIEAFYNVGNTTTLEMLQNYSGGANTLSSVKMQLQLTYTDTNGSVRRVKLPLLTSAVEWAYESSSADAHNAPLHGLFQQGEEIVFRGRLPDFAQGREAVLSYSDANGGDSVAVAAVTICDSDYASVGVSEGMLRFDYPQSAVSFYCASDTKGVYLNNGQSMSVTLKKWNGTERLKSKAKGSRYLVVVQTDSMAEAGTVNDLSVSFSYKLLTGVTVSSQPYSLNSAVNDYYGYWLSADGRDVNCAYRTAVSAGGTMYFAVDIANVYEFVSATFTMPASKGEGDENAEVNGDEWQMSSIAIYELEELGERRVILGAGVNLTDFSTNRSYYRENYYSSKEPISKARSTLMVGPGQSKTVSFESGTISDGGGDATEKNIIHDATELSYEDTKQNFGFNTRRAKYTVNVQVAGDSITSAEDGDCGSKNQFYFQLVFEDENGVLSTSPCVLANQQLKSDGFRTGTLEEFVIYTNDDYGTPVQVNVIPDDTSSISDVFDKLNIEYISVSKTSSTGVNLSWKAEKVGWIDIEYRDDAEAQSGRSNEELIRSFELKESGYSVQIEFGIETASDYVDDTQFSGQLLADISYRDRSGAIKTKYNVDVVSLMADYANRMSDLPDSGTKGTASSLEDFMFKNGYTNRFVVEFNDISSLTKIRFKLTPNDDVTWKISKVFARQVFNQGTLSFNVFNEYERYYSTEPQDLTASDNAKPILIEAPRKEVTYATINFNSGNSITIDLTENAESITVDEGYSEGQYDMIGISAALADTTGITADSTMSIKVVYKNIYGDAYAVNTNLVFDAQSGKFMIPQNSLPQTPNIGMPVSIEVSGSAALSGRQLDAVTVNRIRDRQALEQFLFVPDTGTKLDAANPVTIILSESEQDEYAKRMGYTKEKQQLFLQLGDSTEKALITESQDLLAALVYSEKNDPYGFEHTSEYVSAVDSGYTVINSGDVLTLPMSVSNIGSVKALMLKINGEGIRVNVKKACLSMEETSNISGDRLSTGWVSFPAESALISLDGVAMNTDGASLEQALRSNTRVSPISISARFSGMERSDAIVRLTVYYLDTQSSSHTLCAEHSINEWNMNTISFLAEGVNTVLYYKLEVYDKDSNYTARVYVDELKLSWYNTDGVKATSSYTGANTLTESDSTSSTLLSTSLNGSVSTADGTQVAALASNLVSTGRVDYQKLTIVGSRTINVSASLTGYPGELELSVINSATGESLFGTYSGAISSDTLNYSFTLPINTGKTNQRYTLTIRSKNLADIYSATVYLEVEPTVYIEGIIYGPDGSVLSNFLTLSGNTDLSFADRVFEAGSTITIYARMDNDTNPLQLSASPALGTAFTVQFTSGVTLAGYEGTWTKYTLLLSNLAESTPCSFTLYSLRSSDARISMAFNITPRGSGTEG